MIKLLERREAHVTGASWGREALRQEIREVRQRLACMDSCFDMTDDGELLDSLICQRNGLMVHYGYLLRKAKAMQEDTTEETAAAASAVSP